MSKDIDKLSSSSKIYQENRGVSKQEREEDIKLEDISILYTTTQKEKNRTTFEESFTEKNKTESKQGKEFLDGLIEKKDYLCQELGLSEEEYNSYACIALALATHETGMSEESGYKAENTSWRPTKWIRDLGINLKIKGDASASSGLTQMKIYDFLNSDKLTSEQKLIITSEEIGVEAKSKTNSNLYQNPKMAAAATIVVLDSIAKTYDTYKNILKDANAQLEENIGSDITAEQKYEIGQNLISNISNFYNGLDSKKQTELREQFKAWLMSSNGTVRGSDVKKKYNEEIQLEKLNKLLDKNDANFSFTQSDLNFIRYTLTTENNAMNITEYCAYGWNKGTEETGMQLDRLLTDKIATILYTPNTFYEDQFTPNVANLTEKYANQSILSNGLFLVNEALDTEYEYFGQDFYA